MSSFSFVRKTVSLVILSSCILTLSACDGSGIFHLGKPKPPVTQNFNNPDAGNDGWVTPPPPAPVGNDS